MVGDKHAVETALGFAPTEPDRLLRALQLMIDGGKRGVAAVSYTHLDVYKRQVQEITADMTELPPVERALIEQFLESLRELPDVHAERCV